MTEPSTKGRGAIKFVFWAVCSIGLFVLVGYLHTSGKFEEWYYHKAADEGYAVNADAFKNATIESPATLEIGSFGKLDGLQAVKVNKGDLLPMSANGIILKKIIDEGKRAKVDGDKLMVMVPWKMESAKGFKFKDTFKHKGIETYPWAAVVNVLLVVFIGVSLGYMAEGFTDVIGIKLEKIRHFEGH